MSGGEYIIDERQYEAILQAPTKSIVKIDNATINTSSISEIVELNLYYLKNPEKRPTNELELFSFDKPKKKMNREEAIIAYTHMKEGFNRVVAEQGYPISVAQVKILDKIENLIKKLKNSTETDVEMVIGNLM